MTREDGKGRKRIRRRTKMSLEPPAITIRSMNTYVHPLGRSERQMTPKAWGFTSCPQDLIGHITCSLRICSHFTEKDAVAKNQPFVPVRLFFISGSGTVTADNDRAAQEQATPALASQKRLLAFNSAVPSKSVNLFVAETSISSAYPNETRGGLMKDISTVLLASVFVLFSLLALLSAARSPDHTSSTLHDDQQRVSDLGLRFALKR
jgi:hypothetical protein